MSIAGDIMRARRSAERIAEAVPSPDEPAGAAAPEPVAAAAPEPEPEPVAAPEPEPEPAAPAEPAVAAAAVPAEPEPGSPPTAPQAPADAPDETWNHAVKLSGSEDPKVIARKLVENNTRNADLGRANKALADRLAALEAAGAAPAAPSAPAVAAAAPAAPAPVAAPVAAAPIDYEARAIEIVNGDAEVADLARTYRQQQTRAAQINGLDEYGQPTGTLPTLLHKISALYAQTTEGAAKLGIKPAPEFEQPEIQAELRESRREAQLQQLTFDSLIRAGRDNRDRIIGRKEQVKQELQRRDSEAKRTTEQATVHEAEAKTFGKEVTEAFEAECVAAGLPNTPEYQVTRDEIWNKALDAMQFKPTEGESATADIRGYMRRYTANQLKYEEAAERTRAAARAKLKRKDAAPQAPAGPAAVAPALPKSTGDFRKNLIAGSRARQAAASGR